MSIFAIAASGVPGSTGWAGADPEYQPGVCNIGPAEIARRRRAGHLALVVAVVLLAALVATNAPAMFRLLVALPAAGAVSGYLQARWKFCAGFAARGQFNFGPVGDTGEVTDENAHRRDRRRALWIALTSLALGATVGILAALLPL